MSNNYRIEELRPLYADMIAKNQVELDKFVADFQKDPLRALDWKTEAAIDRAQERHWLTGILEICERLAEKNNGLVDRAEIEAVITRKLKELSRWGTSSTKFTHIAFSISEMKLLNEALEDIYSSGLLGPFHSIDRRVERAEYENRMQHSMWRITNNKGDRWATHTGWTGKVDDAFSIGRTWSFGVRAHTDFAFEPDLAFALDDGSHFTDELFDVCGSGGFIGVDDEVGMLGRHLGTTDPFSLQATRLDQARRVITRRVAKHRTGIGQVKRLCSGTALQPNLALRNKRQQQ